MGLKDFSIIVSEDSLKDRLSNTIDSLIRIFRKSVAEEGFNIGPIKLKNTDLNRVHSIVSEINTRRVFVNCIDDEVPEYARESVRQARDTIRSIIKGIWTDGSEERIIQEILLAMADFETACEKINPFPQRFNDTNYDQFINAIVEMRIKVWTLICYLEKRNGSVIRASNMPPEIMTAVSESELK